MKDGTYIKTQDGDFIRVEVPSGYWVATNPTDFELARSGDLVGVWTDSITNIVHVDSVRLVASATKAVILGSACSQIAIWDNANNTAVTL